MRLLRFLIGLLLPACGFEGAAGLPVPPPMDTMRIERPASPNTSLAAPPGHAAQPDLATRRYDVPPAQLYAVIKRVAASMPDTFAQVEYADRLQAHYVARSKWFNFPDLVTVQVNPDSTLVLWSRSVYGYSDLGVNHKRLAAWLDALDAALTTH